MQYTIRNVPESLDRALRERAKAEGRSLNDVTVQALLQALGLDEKPPKRRDLSSFLGTWVDDPDMERAFEEQRRVDPDAWR